MTMAITFSRQNDVGSHAWTNLVLVIFLVLVESFRFQDQYDYEYDIFSILSSAGALFSVILAGKRGSRCHSTTSFSANVSECKYISQIS